MGAVRPTSLASLRLGPSPDTSGHKIRKLTRNVHIRLSPAVHFGRPYMTEVRAYQHDSLLIQPVSRDPRCTTRVVRLYTAAQDSWITSSTSWSIPPDTTVLLLRGTRAA